MYASGGAIEPDDGDVLLGPGDGSDDVGRCVRMCVTVSAVTVSIMKQ